MRYFQSFILPEELVRHYNLSFAAANFTRNLISSGVFDEVISLMPTSVKGDLRLIDELGYNVLYSNWRKRGYLFAKLAIFHEQVMLFRQIRKEDSIWFYNLNLMNSLLFILLRIFKRSVKRQVIVLDFNPGHNWKSQHFWYLKLINRADGLICLADSHLFTCLNQTILPGVVRSHGQKYPPIVTLNKEFLLSGVISQAIASTKMILEAF